MKHYESISEYNDVIYDSRPVKLDDYLSDKYNIVHNELYNDALGKFLKDHISKYINWEFLYHMFTLIKGDILYDLLLRVFSEQNIIFISDNIEYLTSLVLSMYYLIQPFKWPFIIIPNLPLDLIEVIDSPVPFLIGLLFEPKKISTFLPKNSMKVALFAIDWSTK